MCVFKGNFDSAWKFTHCPSRSHLSENHPKLGFILFLIEQSSRNEPHDVVRVDTNDWSCIDMEGCFDGIVRSVLALKLWAKWPKSTDFGSSENASRKVYKISGLARQKRIGGYLAVVIRASSNAAWLQDDVWMQALALSEGGGSELFEIQCLSWSMSRHGDRHSKPLVRNDEEDKKPETGK